MTTREAIEALALGKGRDVPALIDRALAEARRAGASDLHFLPTERAMELRWRVDGVLLPVADLPREVAPNVVARLKVLAELLTYRSDVPQEGRIRPAPDSPEVRVSTFPTIHGEKAVVRLFAAAGRFVRLDDLGLPDDLAKTLAESLAETSGAILIAGPAGAGKTTTFYACLRELAETHEGRRSIATLEDPVEVAVAGVSQSQIQPAAGFTLAVGLRSLMRQDPEVIGVGEVRDLEVAEGVVGAALTGHLVLSTFHAGGAAEVLGRLLEMGIEPYAIRGGVRAILAQRLVRRLCNACARPADGVDEFFGLPIASARVAVGCDACEGTGYSGRFALAEWLRPDTGGLPALLRSRADVATLEASAIEAGMVPLRHRAINAVIEGRTDPSEVRRLFGLRAFTPSDASRRSS